MRRLPLGLHEGWATVLLLAGMLMSVVWAIQRADWSDDLSILTPITLLALVLGVALAKWQRLPALLAHLIALLVGVVFVVNRLDPVLPLPRDGHGWRPAFDFLRARGATWIANAGTEQYSDDFYLFLLGLAAICWWMAYSSGFLIFRLRWVWQALLLPAVVLLFNLGYAPTSLSSYLILFLLFAFLLVARVHLAEREDEWRRAGVSYPDSLAWRVGWLGLVAAVLIVGVAWTAPVNPRGATLQAAWNRVNGPWQQIEGRFNQMFGSLRGPGARGVGNFASFGDRFRLGGPLKLSQTPILVLQGDYPYYLKVRTFDTFDGHQWDTNVASTFAPPSDGRAYVPQLDLRAGQELAVQPPVASGRHDLNVRMLQPRGAALFTAEQFVKTSNDSYVQLSWTQYRNEVINLATTRREDLPPDLVRVYDLLRSAPSLRDTDDLGNVLVVTPTPEVTPTRRVGAGRSGTPSAQGAQAAATPSPTQTPRVLPTPTMTAQERAIDDELRALETRLVRVRPVVKGGRAVRMIVNGPIPNYGDVEVVLPREALQRGSQYKTTILASNATARQLRDAGTDYPDWVTKRYLQLPDSTSARTRQLAAERAGGMNPYDASVTLQNFLRDHIKYNENIPFPPADRDVVDYLLFDSRQGYCEYYSTAMIVMLRSLGIPAREAVGLFSGEFDNDQGGYLYRESNAHAWVEVYFPTYGWVPFEPTTPRSPFEREEPSGEPGAGDGGETATAGGVGDGLGGDELLPDDPTMLGGGATIRQQQTHPVVRALRFAFPLLALVAVVLAFLWLRGLRGLTPSGQFYARVTRSGALAGVRPSPGATPYEHARAVSRVVPGSRRSLDQIADTYVREQYAGQRPTPQELRLVRRAWLQFRTMLLRSFFRFRQGRDGDEASEDE
jgi:hypothetical protein